MNPSAARLRAFVEMFAAELGRSERRHACVSYLAHLMAADRRQRRCVASSDRRPHALRQFVNRSPWDGAAVLRRLFTIILAERPGQSTGMLVLTDMHLRKQGRHSVGAAPQPLSPEEDYPQKHANLQNIAMWMWADEDGQWPIAAQLYLPFRWTLPTTRSRHAHIPSPQATYRDRATVALSLFDGFRSLLPASVPILIDASYAEDWDLLAELDRRKQKYLVRLPHTGGLWPISSPILSSRKPRHDWTPLERIGHWGEQLNLTLKAYDSAAENKTRQIAIRVPPVLLPHWRKILGFERLLLWHSKPGGWSGFYLTSSPDMQSSLVGLTKQLLAACELRDELVAHGGIRRFEGRTWRGLHHHLTLCFLAHFAMNPERRQVPTLNQQLSA